LLTNSGVLQCWSVADDRFIWKYESRWNASCVDDFVAEVIEDGRTAMIAICVLVTEAPPFRRFFEIVRLDFLAAASRSVFSFLLPHGFQSEEDVFCAANICGDFAVFRLCTRHILQTTRPLYLVRISTQKCLSFVMDTSPYNVELIPGYVILVERDSCTRPLKFQVWDVHVLMSHSFRRRDDNVLDAVTPLLSEVIPLQYHPFIPALHLSALASPLQEGLYTIWIIVRGHRGNEVHKYQLSGVHSRRLSLHRKGHQTSCVVLRIYNTAFHPPPSISYAGYVNFCDSNHQWGIFPLAKCILDTSAEHAGLNARKSRNGQAQSVLPLEPSVIFDDDHSFWQENFPIDVSPYSGAVTFRDYNQVIVNYYE